MKNQDYTQKQELARQIESWANTERSSSFHEIAFNELGIFLDKMCKLEAFAAQVAKTISENMNPYAFKVANVSNKQAWILACAAVENNINL